MTDDALTPEELEDETAEALPDREAMSVLAPPEAFVDGEELDLPPEKGTGDPALPF